MKQSVIDFIVDNGDLNFRVCVLMASKEVGRETFRKMDFINDFGVAFEFAIIKISVGIINRQLTTHETELLKSVIKSVIV